MRIRSARIDDAAAIFDVLSETGGFGFQAREDPAASRARLAQQLATRIESEAHSVIVAVDGRGVLGYAAVAWVPCFFLTGDEAYLSELFIRPAARGRGVGTALLDAVEIEARQRGCARLSLLNMRAADSYRRGFYAAHGWRERTEAAPFVQELNNAE